MPTVYKRKLGVKPRGKWDPGRLREAISRIEAGDICFREAERYYGVPARTIKRRMEMGQMGGPGHGPSSSLGPENEERLVKHIQALGDAGFCPDQRAVRRLAYEFAVALNIKHKFNNEKKIAGYDWLSSFLRRHPELSIRKAEGLSMARGRGLTRKTAEKFYDLLEEQIKQHKLQDKPQNIHNVDETGVQLINKVGKVVAKKGAKLVNKITTGEKGETVSLIACCSAEGRFHPPALIYKGKNLKPEFQDGLPPGSKVYMNQKSAYTTSDIFSKWFGEQFLPRRAPGHCSHVSFISLLEQAENNEVTLLCLPPHTTHVLQPLDKCFFGPFKCYFKTASNTWVEQHVGRKLTRYQIGPLICEVWEKAATVGNGTSGFRSSGIFPLTKSALPDYLFSISDSNLKSIPDIRPTQPQPETRPSATGSSQLEPQPCSSKEPQETPSKLLNKISPVPKLNEGKSKKGGKKGAVVLTSAENRNQLKERLDEKHQKQLGRPTQREQKSGKVIQTRPKRKRLNFEFVSETDEESTFDSDNHSSNAKPKRKTTCKDIENDSCKECGEVYQETKNTCDWLRFATCKSWLHDDCSIFDTFCIDCGLEDRKKSK